MCAAWCVLAIGPANAAATTINVNTTSATSTIGDGLCSLFEAVEYSDGVADADCSPTPASGTTTINLPAGTYKIPDTLEFDYPANLVGAGAASTDIDGGGTVNQVVNLDNGAIVTISGVTISGGTTSLPTCTPAVGTPCAPENGGNGGGINSFGTLTLEKVTVSGNHTAGGATGSYQPPSLCFGGCAAFAAPDGGNGGNGAGIYNETGATLTIDDSTITNNATGAGSTGGVGESGSGTAAGPGETGGTGGDGGDGAGIYNNTGGTLTITDSTISENSTGGGGAGGNGTDATAGGDSGGNSGQGGQGGGAAGIENDGTLTMTGSTLSDNTTGAGGDGAAIGNGLAGGAPGSPGQAGQGGSGVGLTTGTSASTALLNTSIAGNVAGAAGVGQEAGNPGESAGIDNLSFTGTTLVHVTIADNSAALEAGIGGPGGRPITETDSIVASNVATLSGALSCDADLTDGGHNVAFAAPGCPGVTGDPKLGQLENNGGDTQTLALGPGSSAIDLIPTASCGATSDQRGMPRPYGAGCDAGAYESAPPAITGATATTTGPTTATVAGQVTPNLTDAKVVIEYGTSTSYGASTTATDAGNGASATPFSVSMTGLKAGTTYHAKVNATNTDGTTSSEDMTFKTAAAGVVSMSSRPIKGDTVAVKLACAVRGPRCSGKLKLTSRVTTKAGKVIAVAASGNKPAKTKRRTRVETVGNGRYSLAAGTTHTFKLKLNATGRKLLKARHRLPTIATIAGTLKLNKRVTFVYVRRRSAKHR